MHFYYFNIYSKWKSYLSVKVFFIKIPWDNFYSQKTDKNKEPLVTKKCLITI